MTKNSLEVDGPAAGGYRMPPEWHLHTATWLAWPHNRDTWPKNLPHAQDEFLQLASAIAHDEPVAIIVPANESEALLKGIDRFQIGHLPITHYVIPTNDAWLRDYGPTFVCQENQILAIVWKYNAWGGKYPPFDHDQRAAKQITNKMPSHSTNNEPVCCYASSLCLEGGAFDINSEGVLLCTMACALNPNRNPGWSLDRVEAELKSCLGATEVIWLFGGGIEGDDTDGHIDQLARFVPGNKIVYASSANKTDPQYGLLQQNRIDLTAGMDRIGSDNELIALPLPDPVIVSGRRLPASYCNFYVTNRSVMVPQFEQPQDKPALELLDSIFPTRKAVGLPSVNLVVGLGSFHCLTQQQPIQQQPAPIGPEMV